MPHVTQYEQPDGTVPFQLWFDSLATVAALKVRTAIAQMEAGNLGDHKSVGGGVWERRLHFEKGYRIYFAKEGAELVLLFWGGTKSRQQADIERAKQFLEEYTDRKKKAAAERPTINKANKPRKKR